MPALWQISTATVVVDHLHVAHAYSGIHLWLFCDIDIANKGRQVHYFSFFMCVGQENTEKLLRINFAQLKLLMPHQQQKVTFFSLFLIHSEWLCKKLTSWQQMCHWKFLTLFTFLYLFRVSRVPSFLHRQMRLFSSLLEFIVKHVWSLKVSNPSQAQAG